MKDCNTNVWDAVIMVSYFCFLLAFMSAAAYLVVTYNWSWWTMFGAWWFASEVTVRTGCCNDEDEDDLEDGEDS
jgi:hypothetical protein